MKKVYIDVREPYEFASGHVKGAINIPLDQLMSGDLSDAQLTKDTSIIVYCRTGSRSGMAKMILDDMGFKNVINGINTLTVNERYL
ncbi:rhodanese-like domain-containing protein [Candidatus Saccharibacteria bacterium]|nr:rhodanese-like domain-containing protein [Candidatus Saccharibacteria bacterium]